jgi:hypothetical protein
MSYRRFPGQSNPGSVLLKYWKRGENLQDGQLAEPVRADREFNLVKRYHHNQIFLSRQKKPGNSGKYIAPRHNKNNLSP